MIHSNLKPGSRERAAWVLDCVRDALEEHGNIHTLTVSKFRAFRPDDGSPWPSNDDLVRLGGWAVVKAAAASEREDLQPTEQDLAARRGLQLETNYRRKVERKLGDRMSFETSLLETLERAWSARPVTLSQSPRYGKELAAPIDSEVVLFLSDLHFGSVIDPAEVPGNAYNWTVAARRLGLLVHEAATYKISRDEPRKLRILLGGDIIEGTIHGRDHDSYPLAEQIDGTCQMLTSAIDFLRLYFHEINVVCATGNHDRWTERKREVSGKWNGIATTIYRRLASTFRHQHEVKFHVPKTPYTMWTAPGGHQCLLTHGDTVINCGQPSKNLKIDALSSQVSKLAKALGHAIDLVAVGHYHTPLSTQLEDGCAFVVNGCASGTGPYAQSLGIHGSAPTQLLWESVPGHPLGDCRFVRLKAADNEPGWEEIVPVPKRIGE